MEFRKPGVKLGSERKKTKVRAEKWDEDRIEIPALTRCAYFSITLRLMEITDRNPLCFNMLAEIKGTLQIGRVCASMWIRSSWA